MLDDQNFTLYECLKDKVKLLEEMDQRKLLAQKQRSKSEMGCRKTRRAFICLTQRTSNQNNGVSRRRCHYGKTD